MKPIPVASTVLEVTAHPSLHVFGTADIDGCVGIYRYSDETYKRVWHLPVHRKSCRTVAFTQEVIVSGSLDKSLRVTDVKTQKTLVRKRNAHGAPINRIKTIGATLLATGDDEGALHLWDLRTPSKPVQSYQEHEEYITSIAHASVYPDQLLTTGGDGFLTVYDRRKPQCLARSDVQEQELLSCVTGLKGGRLAVTGDMEGTLGIWKHDRWGDVSDRFPGHPESIDTMCAVDDTVIVTGCADAKLRFIQLHPNKLLCSTTLGNGQDPIESVCASFDQQHLFASTHGQYQYPFAVNSIWQDQAGQTSNDVKKAETEEKKNEEEDEDSEDDEESKPTLSRQEKKRQRQTSMQSTDYKLEKNGKTKKNKTDLSTSEAATFFADL